MIYEFEVSARRLRSILAAADVRLDEDTIVRFVADPVTRTIFAERVVDEPERGTPRQTVRPDPAYL